jgi:hypothetical protein
VCTSRLDAAGHERGEAYSQHGDHQEGKLPAERGPEQWQCDPREHGRRRDGRLLDAEGDPLPAPAHRSRDRSSDRRIHEGQAHTREGEGDDEVPASADQQADRGRGEPHPRESNAVAEGSAAAIDQAPRGHRRECRGEEEGGDRRADGRGPDVEVVADRHGERTDQEGRK